MSRLWWRCVVLTVVNVGGCTASVSLEESGREDIELGAVSQAMLDMPPRRELPPGSDPDTSVPVPPAGCATSGRCFGAVGMECEGGGIANVVGFIGCPGGRCYVSSGSIMHDECCAAHPDGRWCGGPLSDCIEGFPCSRPCNEEWQHARAMSANGLAWLRAVDQCESNHSGQVDMAKYCAPGGTVLLPEDRVFCCGAASRPFVYGADDDLAAQQGVRAPILLSRTPLRVCTGDPSPTPRPGTSSTRVNNRPCNRFEEGTCGEGATCSRGRINGVDGWYCALI